MTLYADSQTVTMISMYFLPRNDSITNDGQAIVRRRHINIRYVAHDTPAFLGVVLASTDIYLWKTLIINASVLVHLLLLIPRSPSEDQNQPINDTRSPISFFKISIHQEILHFAFQSSSLST